MLSDAGGLFEHEHPVKVEPYVQNLSYNAVSLCRFVRFYEESFSFLWTRFPAPRQRVYGGSQTQRDHEHCRP